MRVRSPAINRNSFHRFVFAIILIQTNNSEKTFPQVDFTDEVTKYVCRPCADKIVELHQFHQMYLESEKKLKELMRPDFKLPDDEVNNLFDCILSGATNFDIPLEWECSLCLEKFYDQSLMDIHKRNCGGIERTVASVAATATAALPSDVNGFQLTYFEDNNSRMIMSSDTVRKELNDGSILDDLLKMDNAIVLQNVPALFENNDNIKIAFRYKCIKCGQEYDSSQMLLEHDAMCVIHANAMPAANDEPIATEPIPIPQIIEVPKNWICKKCGDVFDAKIALNEHKYSKHRNPNKTYKFPQNYHRNECGEFVCDFCGKGFATRGRVNGHIRSHTDEKALCNMCGKSFSSRNNLSKHHKTVHLKEKNFQCHVCENRYDSSYRLKIHLNRHQGIRQFVCKFCNNRFMTTSALERHKKTMHSDTPRVHVCSICSKGFKVAENLRAHLTTHTGFRGHICVHCGAEFTRKTKLDVHIEESHGVNF